VKATTRIPFNVQSFTTCYGCDKGRYVLSCSETDETNKFRRVHNIVGGINLTNYIAQSEQKHYLQCITVNNHNCTCAVYTKQPCSVNFTTIHNTWK